MDNPNAFTEEKILHAPNGMLMLIYAHLFSLDLMRDIFARQVTAGKGPIPAPAAA